MNPGTKTKLGMVGLGRMGSNMVRRLLRAGHVCVVHDVLPQAGIDLEKDGAINTATMLAFVEHLEKPRTIWIMVPAAAVDATLDALVVLLAPDDTIIDGGNSHFHDDIRRAKALKHLGIHYLDVGTSGGVHGFDRGYCQMIGGDPAVVKRVDDVFASLAPGRLEGVGKSDLGTAGQGYIYCGAAGAGHFVKMIHNGIEYGIMAAYAEGLNILHHANDGSTARPVDAETTPMRHPEHYRYPFDLAGIAEAWRHGSVIGSWLLDLTAAALKESPDLKGFAGRVSDSGEGRFALAAAIDEGVPAPILAVSLAQRFASRGEENFANQFLSALRFQFGGHVEKSGTP